MTTVGIDAGVAGRSSMREYERRHKKREERVRARWGRLAGLVLALSDDPVSTRVWWRGSQGESKLAAAMDKIQRDDVVILHDRRVTNTSGNIDHLVIAPTGVYVVDAKRYTGRVEVRDASGLFGAANPRLFVGRWDCSKLADSLRWQVDAVRKVLASRPDVPITSVLCFIGSEWPLLGGSTTYAGVRLDGPRSLRKQVCRPGALSVEEVRELALVLSHGLPS